MIALAVAVYAVASLLGSLFLNILSPVTNGYLTFLNVAMGIGFVLSSISLAMMAIVGFTGLIRRVNDDGYRWF